MTGDLIYKLGGRAELEVALLNNLKWITKSFSNNNDLGSSGWSNVLGHFSEPYPETTGYILPTLINANKYFEDRSYLKMAKKQIQYFISIQNEDGSFHSSNNNKSPLVFDSSQILLGMCHLHQYSPDKSLFSLIQRTHIWLLSMIDENGYFKAYNYTEQNCPAYYSRVFWAILLSGKVLNKTVEKKIDNGINTIINLRNSDNTFSNWGFNEEEFVLTHNIIYTIRGLYEISLLIQNKHLSSIVESCVNSISAKIISEKKFYGAYNQQWDHGRNFICSTGNAQLAYLLLAMNANKHIDVVPIILEPLLKQQKLIGPNKGAIPSSIPIWGRYQRWRYTNWTQKFFCDALIELLS